ncbi:type VII secretion protein EccE [Rhodococcus sp. NPDC058521]|uniref:type VII secretion protein EccE n=1 Tax=Rhodococcus sp. NPDC058521 TaxID=3346536 RepID=UPI00365DF889
MDRSRRKRASSVWFTITDLVIAQVFGLFFALVAGLCGLSFWICLPIGLVLMAVALIRVGGWSTVDWIRTAWRYSTKREYQITRAVDYEAPTDQSIGLRWDGTDVVALVEVLPPHGNLTQISRGSFKSTHLLPTAAIASCLTQHDISLSGIDIVSHGYRAASGSPATDVYDRLVGPLPATATRTVWLVLRFDALAAKDAVDRRGGGREGAARSITMAANRIVRTLADNNCSARILTAPEVDSAALQVSRGVVPTAFEETWHEVTLPGVSNTGYEIDPKVLSRELLAKLWVPSSLGTTVTVRLRPGSIADHVQVGAGFRITTRTPIDSLNIPGLVSMTGRHRDGLLAHLPIAVNGADDRSLFRDMSLDTLDSLTLPPSGCGQLVGSDDEGHGITARIAGLGISTVYVAGELYLAQQLLFRAIATGARVLIHTDRPDAWAPFINSIATHDRLRLAGQHPQTENRFNTVVFDGVNALPSRAGVTAVYLFGDPSQWPAAEPDLSLYQPNAIGDRITLSTAGTSIELMLVTISSESAYIGRPRTLEHYQPAY